MESNKDNEVPWKKVATRPSKIAYFFIGEFYQGRLDSWFYLMKEFEEDFHIYHKSSSLPLQLFFLIICEQI